MFVQSDYINVFVHVYSCVVLYACLPIRIQEREGQREKVREREKEREGGREREKEGAGEGQAGGQEGGHATENERLGSV